jgi:2'-5' RNA ligase
MLRAADGLKLEHAPRGTWTAPERLHLTLYFLGDYSQLHMDRVDVARSAADKINIRGFDITLDSAASFHGKTPPWVLRSSETPAPLQDCWHALGSALASAGFDHPPESNFVPHVTLLRHADKSLPATAIGPITWTIRDLVLMHSRIGQQREYSVLHRWALS